MSRRLVVLLDGTGNEIGANLSNVLRLYRAVRQSPDQLVYYDPGVGTIGRPGWWSQLRQKVRSVLGLALGLGLDEDLLQAYSWICRNWRPGDEIWLFGFSRGAYTARALAGFIHFFGLLGRDQLNLCGYALVAYKRSGDEDDFEIGDRFREVAGTRRASIHFVGVWDTVASVLVPRASTFFVPAPQKLLFTRTNPSVRTFRQAISIDERRRMFRLNHWKDPQSYRPGGDERLKVPQDIRQVWFAGVHSDVGGGYPDDDSALSRYPLLWMAGQAAEAGLDLDPALLPPPLDVPPAPLPTLHRSLIGPWWLLEPWPQRNKEKEWPGRRSFLGLYVPWAEPRPIPNRPWKGVPAKEPFLVHSSVLERIAACPGYRPVNLPETYRVETFAGPPAPPVPPAPYRPEGAAARLGRLFSTKPDGAGWAGLGKTALWLVPALALLGWLGGFAGWDPQLSPRLALLAVIAFFLPVLAEEALFRGILLKPPSDGVTPVGPAVFSAALFALWNPFWAFACSSGLGGRCPPWAELGFDPWFLACTFALGLACARLALATRSIWPGAILHWAVLVGWVALFGGPDTL
ncbi:MAG TPA: DUF2235 domain-containing protein [Allosphingosinicella sp.]|jgi:uncharacterized protein (DUF2235 family)/membrane protease YdiL (CAAX protease family)